MDAPPRKRNDRSDAELLSAIAGRDGAAFAVFYRRHVPLVLAYLLAQTDDREAAADLAAEVFAAVLLAAARYSAKHESAAPWVIGIARNKLLTTVRRGQVDARARHRLGFQALTLEDQDLDRMERLALDGSGRLVRLLEELPEEARFAFGSWVIEERSYHELAGRLMCSELVVRKRGSRGRDRMREQLEESGSA